MALNTDLALESYRELSKARELAGVRAEEFRENAAAAVVSRTELISEEAAQTVGKPRGLYITIECDEPLCEHPGEAVFSARVKLLAECISEVCRERDDVLVAGLGNRFITPDALGPKITERVFVTRHIGRCAPSLLVPGMAAVSAVAAGVMGQTGLESCETVKALTRACGARQVVVCDALACSEPSHMGRTIQLCSSGISPGSGVDNSREELSAASLGAPTAAIGIPTVSRLMSDDPRFEGLLVTPKQIDRLIKAGAELIADALNMFLHPGLSPAELRLLML